MLENDKALIVDRTPGDKMLVETELDDDMEKLTELRDTLNKY